MMRFVILLCLLLASAGAGAAAPVLTVSTNNTPLDRRALEELSREAFRRVGLTLELIVQPSERSLQAAEQGQVDGEGLRIAGLGAQYPNLLQVPEPYIGVSFVAFARKVDAVSVERGWASLEPHRVAFITGWKMFEANATHARIVSKVSTPEQLFRMLESDRIDLALYTLADGSAILKRLGMTSIVPLKPSLRDVNMYLYLHRRHEAWVPRIAQALRAMKSDGTHARILGVIAAE